ncbi:MAG: hypothetical protein EGQ03_04660 [Collinsella aerofaciens]|nr:hypothetical protein [Collinsella aerofaciens]
MEEFELKDEQQEENVKTMLTETDLEHDDAEKKPLMQATREKVEAIPDIVREGAAKAVQLVKEHKKEIVAWAAAIGAVAYVANNSHEKDQLLEKNTRLTEENAQLSDDLVIEREVSDRLASRVVELENLCDEKDDYFRETISDGLRHGSSLAGKHMADRRQYLNEG